MTTSILSFESTSSITRHNRIQIKKINKEEETTEKARAVIGTLFSKKEKKMEGNTLKNALYIHHTYSVFLQIYSR